MTPWAQGSAGLVALLRFCQTLCLRSQEGASHKSAQAVPGTRGRVERATCQSPRETQKSAEVCFHTHDEIIQRLAGKWGEEHHTEGRKSKLYPSNLNPAVIFNHLRWHV